MKFYPQKSIRLTDKQLQKADIHNLIRLAIWLNCMPNFNKWDSVKEFHQKIRYAIARKEKQLFKLPNQGREE